MNRVGVAICIVLFACGGSARKVSPKAPHPQSTAPTSKVIAPPPVYRNKIVAIDPPNTDGAQRAISAAQSVLDSVEITDGGAP